VLNGKNNKMVVVTTQMPTLDNEARQLVEVCHVAGLDIKTSENLFSFWFRFEREDLTGQAITYPDRVLALVQGHPLAVKLAAKLWAERPVPDVTADLSLFKRLREQMVPYVLDHVKLAPHEEEFLRFVSIFRVAVPGEVFAKWRGDDAMGLLESLLGRSLLESDGDGYNLHPIIRDHFYVSTAISILRPFHLIAGSYFLGRYKAARAARMRIDPEIVAEAVHHFLCAGEREKVREFGLYKHELRPVALMHYRKREYDLALKEYRLLLDLDPTDHDVHFHLALLYAGESRWDHAEVHFGKAIEIKPGGFWILQGYAHALLRANRDLSRAEHFLLQSEKMNPLHSPTLVDLGRLREKFGEDIQAEEYFRRAIDADGDNTQAYYAYARFLKNQNRFEEGLAIATAAVETNPIDPRNKALVRELRQRIEDARGQA
jgi:tetratricopeptide (TPR) repeat protein